MPVLISRSSFLFAILFCCIYFIAGKEAPLNWDEEASIDIALGIRPQFMKNPDGSLIKELPYGQILQSSTFTSADYKKFNDAKGVVHATWRDNSNSVLYYLTLHYLMKVSGLNITVLRFLTIFLSGICLLLIFQIAARCSNGSVYIPLLAMVLMGCNPVFFSTAFVIRGYMLCLALLLSATYVWLQIIQSKKYSFGQLSLFGLLCAAAVLTHYFSLAVVSFFFLHLAVTTSRRWMAWLMGLALFMVPLLFWLYISWEEGIKNLMLLDAAWSGASKGKNWEVTGVNYLKQLFNAFTYLTGIDANNPLLPRMVWQGLAAVVLLGIAWQLIKRRRVSLFFYITAWVILLYSIKSFSAGHFMIFEKKYLLFIVPYFILAVVLCIEAKVALLSVLFVTVFSFVTSANSLQKSAVKLNPTDKNIIPNDVRAFSLLAKQVSTADSIIYTRWQAAHRMNYFLRPGVQQRVDTTQKANLIWIKSGNTQRLVEVK